MSDDQAVELLRRSWGLAPKQLLVSVPLETLSQLTFCAGVTAGTLATYCQTPEQKAEADRMRRELSCLFGDLYRIG